MKEGRESRTEREREGRRRRGKAFLWSISTLGKAPEITELEDPQQPPLAITDWDTHTSQIKGTKFTIRAELQYEHRLKCCWRTAETNYGV